MYVKTSEVKEGFAKAHLLYCFVSFRVLNPFLLLHKELTIERRNGGSGGDGAKEDPTNITFGPFLKRWRNRKLYKKYTKPTQ